MPANKFLHRTRFRDIQDKGFRHTFDYVATRLSRRRRGALQISLGTGAGQSLALIAAPLLARLYSPRDFGVFAVVSALSFMLATIFTLRLDLAIPLPRTTVEAYSVATVALVATFCLCVVTTAAILIIGEDIAVLLGEPAATRWLTLAPVTAAATATVMVLSQFCVRNQQFALIGRRNLLHAVVTVASQTALGALGGRPGGLIAGMALGQAAGVASLVRNFAPRSPEARKARSLSVLLKALQRYKRFPLILAPAGLLNSVGVHLPLVLFAYWYGVQAAGWLGLTQRVLAAPLMLLGVAISQVYVASLAQSVRDSKDDALPLFTSTSTKLLLLSASVGVPLAVFGPTLFQVVFGEQWTASGRYAQALAIGLAAQLVASPLSQTLVVLERQTTQILWDAGRASATAGAVVVPALTSQPPLVAVWALGAAFALSSAASWWLSRRAVSRADRKRRG